MEFDWVMGCGLVCGSKVFTLRRVGLGQSFGEMGRVGLKKLDPRTTLRGSDSVSVSDKRFNVFQCNLPHYDCHCHDPDNESERGRVFAL